MKVLFRNSVVEQEEKDGAAPFFDLIDCRSEIKPGDFVIPRYSALPYYDELEKDVKNLGGSLINSYEQHKWVADFHWYNDLRKFTFDTWTIHNIAHAPLDIAYVVKGKTNSKKWQWNTKMYAPNREQAIRIGCDLLNDALIGSQGVLYRRYEKLKTFEIGINGLPFTNEYRFFFYKNELLAHSYYWSIADELQSETPKAAIDLAKTIAKIASKHCNFYVLDIAQREDDTWVLVEVNCGTMSGLSLIEPYKLYQGLKCQLQLFGVL